MVKVAVRYARYVAGMLASDRWGEVLDTIKRNKLRTMLTAVSVAWGIFVMVVLLGMGHGPNNGIRHTPQFVTSIGSIASGKTVETDRNPGRRVLSDGVAYEADKVLEGPICCGTAAATATP